jgi:hypothetical protein
MVSSGTSAVTIVKDVVKYVDREEEVFTGERRRYSEMASGTDSGARRRIHVRTANNQWEGERIIDIPEPEPVSGAPPATRGGPAPPLSVESNLEEVIREEPPRQKRIKGVPKPPRHIRMMLGQQGSDVTTEI